MKPKGTKETRKEESKMEDENAYRKAQTRLSDLLKQEQGRLGLNNSQMSQRINVHPRTYDRLINGGYWKERGCCLWLLCNIFANTNINPCDVFGEVS